MCLPFRCPVSSGVCSNTPSQPPPHARSTSSPTPSRSQPECCFMSLERGGGQVISVSNQSRKYIHRWMERWLDGWGDRHVHRRIGGRPDGQTGDVSRAWSGFLSLSTTESWGLDQSLMQGVLGTVGCGPASLITPHHPPGASLPTPSHNNCLQASANVHQGIKSPHFRWF